MAEMTVSEASQKLKELFMRTVDGQEFVLLIPTDAKQISALIERQAAEIERLNQTWPNSCEFKDDDGCCLFPCAMTPECHADACSVIKGLKQEIAKKDRMIQAACKRLAVEIAECPTIPCKNDIENPALTEQMQNEICKACWLAWLEKEAEV